MGYQYEYVDASQFNFLLTISKKINDALEYCLNLIMNWMRENKLKLNLDKMKMLLVMKKVYLNSGAVLDRVASSERLAIYEFSMNSNY